MILSTTLKKYRKTLVDNIFKSNAVWVQLKELGAIQEEDGGERIVEPLMYGTNSTAGSYSGYETLDTTPQTGIDSAEFNWKQYSASITISGEELRKNAGSSRIINLLDAKIKQAEMSLQEELVRGLFSDGTGNGGRDLTGLEAMVNNTGTYGGINSTSGNTWWRSTVESNSEALSLSDMRTAYNSASRGGADAPTLIITSQALYETYESFGAQVSISGGGTTFSTPTAGRKKLMDLGMQTQEFKGAPMVWDEQCPSDRMYFLNTKHMKLVVHKDANFDTTDFVKPANQDAKVAQILFMGNLTTNRRKSHALLDNKS